MLIPIAILATLTQPPSAKPELVLNIGHVATVRAVAFSPDGKTIASAGDDQRIKLWDAKTGLLRQTLTGHSAPVTALAFAADSKSLLSAGLDGTVRGWSTATGTQLGTLAAPDSLKLPLRAIAVTLLEGTTPLVVGAGHDGAVTLWKASTGDTPKPELVAAVAPAMKEGQKPVLAVAFSTDSKRFATGAGDGSVVVYDAEDGSLQYRLRGHAMPVVGLAFSPNSKFLADASADGESALFDLTTGKRTATLQMNRPGDGIGAVAFSPDSAALVTGGAHGPRDSDYLQLWSAQNPSAPQRGALLQGHERFVTAVAFSPDGKTIASAGRDRSVRLWNRATHAQQASLGGAQQLLAVATQPGAASKGLASAGADGLVRLWSRETGELLRTLSGHTGPVRAVTYTPDGKLVASAGRDQTVRLWDAETGRALKTITGAPGPINALGFLPDGKSLVAACSAEGDAPVSGHTVLFEISTGRLVRTFEQRNTVGPVVALAVSPDGKSVAVGTGTIGSSQVRFHETETGAVKSTDEVPMPITSLAFSPDGKRVAVGTAQRRATDDAAPVGEELRLYNGQTFAYQKSLLGPRRKDDDESPSGIAALAFSEEGKVIVSAGLDGSVRLWNPRTGTGPDATLSETHLGEATGAIAVFGGNQVVTGGRDNVLLIHKTNAAQNSGQLLATLVPILRDDYLAVTAEGYYEGSPGAARLLSWRLGDNVFPVEAYEPLLHKPAELRKALVGELGASRFNQGGTVPPQLAFELPNDGDPVPNTSTITVRVAVSDAKKVERLEVLANGRPVSAKPIQLGSKPIQLGSKPIQLGSKPIQLGSKAIPPGHTVEQTFETTVPIPSGNDPVTLTAIAYGADNLSGREQILLQRGGAAGSGQTGGNLYVLSVGVSTYQNPKFNLKYAQSDAAAFSELWKGGTGLYNKTEVKQLSDSNATAANVRAALFQLLETATEKDTVAVFLSGHGIQAGEGSYYFATTEIDASTRESVAKTALPWTALQTTLAGIKARRVLLFLDACHSGGALGEGQQASGERMAELLAKRAGVLVFSSSRGSEYSYELDTLKHGAFTAALMEALGQGKADLDIAGGGKDGLVTAEELLAFLRARVPQLTENRQTPTCPLLRDFGDAYPVVRLR